MNRFLPLTLLLCAHLAFGQQPSGRYTITGYLTHLQGRTVYLVSESSLFSALSGNKAAVLDSAQSMDGHFTLQGVLNEPHQYALLVGGVKSAKHFLLSQAPLTIIGSADSIGKASVEGSSEVRHQQILANQLKPFREQIRQLTLRKHQAVQQHDTTAESKAIQDQRFLSEQIQATTIAFIERYPGSLASLFELNLLVHDLPKEKARALWNQLTSPLQQHSIGQSIHQKLFPGPEQPGQPAPSLILADQRDTPVSLQAYRGTLTLVDFWASGCEPCRQEHARLRTLYERYKEKGLQIVSISIDANPLLWKKALQKYQLPWPQLTDRVGNKNVIGSQYGTNQLPINMLIDQEGNVIRKGLHGAELEKQVAAAFSAK